MSHLCFDVSAVFPTECVSQSLATYLYNIKEKIHTCEKEWDIYKKYTNTYEYIHTVVHHKKKSVSKYKPLSRSYFKMIELLHEFQLVDFSTSSSISTNPPNVFSRSVSALPGVVPPGLRPIRTFHLAEGPGGFIEAVVNTRKTPGDVYIGMTILDDKQDPHIPAWKKSDLFLYSHPNVRIEKGGDGTGDILSLANFDHCIAQYASSMDFITADGGFDFSTDFNKQEMMIARLLFAQIAFALALQKQHGNFVLKLFDCFYANTLDLLYVLSSMYKTVYIAKPQTSRAGNSEKYVVCKGFLPDSSESFVPRLRGIFMEMSNPLGWPYIHRFLRVPLPAYFMTRVEEYNSIFGQQQIENIHTTLSMIDKAVKPDRLEHGIQLNLTKCMNWCIRHNVPYHVFTNHNVFL